MCTTGNEDAVTVQAGTFSWDRNERPVLEKYVCNMYIIISIHFIYGSKYFVFHHLQHQSEHQAWSVGGSSGSRGSW